MATQTRPDPGSTRQTTLPPSSRPRSAATASGTVVRTDPDPLTDLITLEENSGIEGVRASPLDNIDQCIDQRHKYDGRHIGQLIGQMSDAKPSEPGGPRPTYAQNWPAYNAAQAAEFRLFHNLLSDLVENIEEPQRQGAGRPSIPLRDQAFCTIQKVYSQMSCRRAHGLIEDAADRGQVGHAPHYNTSSKFLSRPDATPILRALLRLTAMPLAVFENQIAIDSTGFRTRSFGAYCAEKHGVKREHVWLKAHLSTGVRTNIITDAIVTDSVGKGTGDSTLLPPLLQGTADAGFKIERVNADKAYSSRRVYQAIETIGAEAFIPFRSNARGLGKGSALWHKAFYFFQLHRAEFDPIYHKRSNVEATIAAIKKKLGENLKSKGRVAQENELLSKVIAYNITILIHEMHENGISPDFSTS